MNKPLRTVFLAATLFALHLALVSYINSSMLSVFFDTRTVAIAYALGACVSLSLLFFLPRILRSMGLVPLTMSLLSASGIALLVMSRTTEAMASLISFVIYISLNASIAYCFDIFIEHYSIKRHIGSVRGSYLALTNAIWIIAPIITATVVAKGGFGHAYSLGAGLVIFAFVMISRLSHDFTDKAYHVGGSSPFAQLLANTALRRIATLDFMLQLFYVWMVIYSPLYLIKVIGMSWHQIGIVFSSMLVAFAVVQYPAGKIADHVGEKKLLQLALVICAVATFLFAQLQPGATVVTVTGILFLSRIGAALLEVMCDSYFFKHINEAQAGAASAYRMIIPLSYIIGASFGSLLLIGTSYAGLFTVLSGLFIAAAVYSVRLSA